MRVVGVRPVVDLGHEVDTALVAGSYTGVLVMPMLGTRSPQPIAEAGHAGPTLRDQVMAPVAGFMPVDPVVLGHAMTVPPTTIGWA